MTQPSWPSDWIRAILPMAVMRCLRDAPQYGYSIATLLKEAGLGTIKGGTLYPLLSRLERDHLVVSEWRAGNSGPSRKYFSLSDAGHARLELTQHQWDTFVATVAATSTTEEPHD